MAKRKETLRLHVDGWNDSDEAAAQSENGAAAKKRKLSLSLMKKTRTDRFHFVDEVKTESLSKKIVPKNTENNTKWAVSTFLLWRDRRNVSFKEPDYQVPEDLLISTDTALLCKWLTYFIAEVRRKDGANYPPKTIYLLLTGLLRHMRSRNVTCPNFLDTSDARFVTFHNALDNILRDLRMRGVGAQTRQTEAFSKEDEDRLWSSGVLSSENPKSLLRAVFYLNGKNFCLRGGEEQRNLKISQLKRLKNPDQYVYTENASKNRCGGLKQMRVQNKTVPIIAVPESGNRCHVFILDTYLGKLSPEAIESDNFYVQPIAKCDLSKSWFTAKPVGKNTLGKMVK